MNAQTLKFKKYFYYKKLDFETILTYNAKLHIILEFNTL